MISKNPHRNTIQRKVILEALREQKTHPSAAELYVLAQKHLPNISLGTVYRNLELLAQMGMIQKLTLGSDGSHFDGITTPHQHIQCIYCNRVDDIEGPPPELMGGGNRDLKGYRILSHRVEFFGVCPECQQNSAAANDNP